MTDDPRSPIRTLHAEVDADAGRLASRLGARLRCARGCSSCCVDEITIFEVEAERIRLGHAELLESGRPHPAGACAFLDHDGACRVYDDRPYVCRTQGLPLRWTEPREGAVVEWRDICPLNDPGRPPIDELDAGSCWTLGPVEARLGELEHERRTAPRRVSLRSLFVRD